MKILGGAVINNKFKRKIFHLFKPKIVLMNLFTVIVGISLALDFSGESITGNLYEIIFCLVATTEIVAGSCLLNNIIDFEIDQRMKRTCTRFHKLTVSDRKLLTIFAISIITIGLLTLSTISVLSFMSGLIGFFVYVVVYTIYSKRKTAHNTIIGSLSGAMPLLIGWFAIEDNLSLSVLGIFIYLLIWQMPHFYALAIIHVDDYRRANIPMLPVEIGVKRTINHIKIWILLLVISTLLTISPDKNNSIVFLIINLGWFYLLYKSYFSSNSKKFASAVFRYSIISMILFYTSIIIFSLT